MTNKPNDSGWIEVICGNMFSGKTEELIRRLRRAEIAQLNVAIFKPKIDTRYEEGNIVSHNQLQLKSSLVESATEIAPLAKDADVVGIDEVQFFDDTIITTAKDLAANGKRVIIAGLDTDYRGLPLVQCQVSCVKLTIWISYRLYVLYAGTQHLIHNDLLKKLHR